MQKTDPASYRFGNVELDVRGRRVQVAGQPCPLEPKSFELLKFLVENRGRAIGKDEIVTAVWPGTFVTDNSLTRAVTKIRKALGDDSREPKYIETIPTVGYRFTADCTVDGEEAVPSKNAPAEFISIAVLPVANRTGDADMEYLAEGLTDGAMRLLSEIPKLRVIARSTVYRFKIAAQDALSFARSLGVNIVLSGELKRLGNRMVFDAELTDVGEGTIVLSRQYWPNPSDWMDVQSDLALDVARGLNLELDRWHSARLSQHPTVSSEAYQSYLRGEFLSRRLAPASLHQALAMFAEALRLDDRFALAWAETAQVHVFLGLYFEPSSVHMPAAKEAATRALELDDSLQVAHAALAIIHLAYEWDYDAAERELASAAVCRRAISSLTCAAHLLEQTGRGRDAEGLIRSTLTFDPRNPSLFAELGCNNYYRRRYEQAVDQFQAAAELDPETPFVYWGMGKSYGQMKRYDEALAILRAFKERAGFEPPLLTAEIGYVLGMAGRHEEAREIVRQLEDTSRTMYVNPYLISLVWLGVRDLDQTFSWLERAYREKSTFVVSIPTEPKWQSVRNDPRFQSVLARIGFGAR